MSRVGDAHRRDLAVLSRQATLDLGVVMHGTVGAGAIATRDAMLDVLPGMVEAYGLAAASLGADWYDDLRDQAGVKGRFTAIPGAPAPRSRAEALARWGVDPLFSATPDPALALSKTAGGLQRLIANADRDTITGSAIEDPGARGWGRESAGGCDFCRMLSGRGAVYTEATAQFETHDKCRCVAVPLFVDTPVASLTEPPVLAPAGVDLADLAVQQAVAEVALPARETVTAGRVNPFTGRLDDDLIDEAEALAARSAAGYDDPQVRRITAELERRNAPADRSVVDKVRNMSPDQRDVLAEMVITADEDGSRITALAELFDELDGGVAASKTTRRLLNTDPILKAGVNQVRRQARAEATAARRAAVALRRSAFDTAAEARFLAAEEETRGNLLRRSVRGNREKIGRDLFAGKLPAARMRSIVTPELAEWFAAHGWPEPYRVATGSAAERTAFIEQRGRLSEFD